MNWRTIPFFRLTLPFVAGIWLAAGQEVALFKAFFWAFPVLFGLLWFFWQRRTGFQTRWLYGVVLSIFLFLFGYQFTALHHELNRPRHFKDAISQENYVSGVIQRLRPGGNSMRLILKVEHLGSSPDTLLSRTGFLLAYVDLDGRSRSLNYGDQIILKGRIRPIEPPKNPKTFDFAWYMHLNNTHFSIRADSLSWEKRNDQASRSILALTDQLRQRCIAILRKHLPADNEFAVGAALILGYKDEISQEVTNAYVNTGAMHVLAVSGMHVGIVYLCIGALLGFLKFKSRHWKFVKMLLLLAGVWGFAVLTGAAPSALRAAAMFSFVIVGQSLDRQPNIYNTFAASAFLLLCINPYLLFDIGFQLSYLAVIGIVYFQPLIYRLWYIENKIGDYFWKLSAVSLAAQITTLPISLLYFHQFPLYFWLSGLAVVPISGFILMGGMALFILDGIPVIGWLLGQAVYWLVWITNASIFLIQQIPGGVITGIWLSVTAAILLYGAIAALTGAFEFRRFRWVLVALACFVGVAGLHALREWQNQTRRQVLVYHLPGHTVIDLIDGKKIISLSDGDLEPSRINFAAGNYRLFTGVAELVALRADTTDIQTDSAWFLNKGLFQFYGFKMAVVRQAITGKVIEDRIPVDCLLVSNNARADLEDLLRIFDCKLVLFDASSSPWRVERWKEEAIRLGIPFYDIREQGAFVRDL
ncbi:MAG: ComEC/Rec2 family competence protein [Saprospiraceae bacterium]|nr:ComEC/Rec2 family competence protein [Saprospiraceae bacterium]